MLKGLKLSTYMALIYGKGKALKLFPGSHLVTSFEVVTLSQ